MSPGIVWRARAEADSTADSVELRRPAGRVRRRAPVVELGGRAPRRRTQLLDLHDAPGRPSHVVPVWGLWIEDAGWFGTSRQSQKARNLTARPTVVVHLESGDETVIVEGYTEEVADHDARVRFENEYEQKYDFRPDLDNDSPGYVVRPRIAQTWLESDYPRTATRWLFDAMADPEQKDHHALAQLVDAGDARARHGRIERLRVLVDNQPEGPFRVSVLALEVLRRGATLLVNGSVCFDDRYGAYGFRGSPP